MQTMIMNDDDDFDDDNDVGDDDDGIGCDDDNDAFTAGDEKQLNQPKRLLQEGHVLCHGGD